MAKSAKRFFLSYAHQDREFARELAKQRGATVLIESPLATANRLEERLRSQLDEATALILIVPARDVKDRNQIWFEAGAAKALGKKVLAVVPPERTVARSDLPVDLASFLVLDTQMDRLSDIADALVHAVPSVETRATRAS